MPNTVAQAVEDRQPRQHRLSEAVRSTEEAGEAPAAITMRRLRLLREQQVACQVAIRRQVVAVLEQMAQRQQQADKAQTAHLLSAEEAEEAAAQLLRLRRTALQEASVAAVEAVEAVAAVA
jgi:hypothetical protein